MTFNINVRGGTDAGIRIVKSLVRWTCDTCGRETDTYSCPNLCGTRRPN